MFSNIIVGLVAGLGVAAWVYNYFMKTTGGRTPDALIGAGIAGFFTILVITSLLSALF